MEAIYTEPEYSTSDGIIGLIVLAAVILAISIVAMWSCTALFTYTWITGKCKNPAKFLLNLFLVPLFALMGR